MSKEELFFKLNQTLLDIKKIANDDILNSSMLLNYEIDCASKYLMMLMFGKC